VSIAASASERGAERARSLGQRGMTTSLAPNSADDPEVYRPVAFVDLLDRVLATGMVVSGDITISIADVDLVRVSLRALISSVGTLVAPSGPSGGAG
jgi:Gas vesicle protein